MFIAADLSTAELHCAQELVHGKGGVTAWAGRDLALPAVRNASWRILIVMP